MMTFFRLLGDGYDADGFAEFFQFLPEVLQAAELVIDQNGGDGVGHQLIFIVRTTRVPAGWRSS